MKKIPLIVVTMILASLGFIFLYFTSSQSPIEFSPVYETMFFLVGCVYLLGAGFLALGLIFNSSKA
jgi:cytochrome c oxidase assembly factor CtaG